MPSNHVFGAFSPDNEIFVTIGDNGSHINVYETFNLTHLIKIFCSGTFIQKMSFTVDSELLFVITTDCKIRIYCLKNDSENFQMDAYFINELNCLHRYSLNSFIISPDNKYLFTSGSDNLVKVWELAPNLSIYSAPQLYIGHVNPISAMILPPESQKLFTCGGFEGIYAWDIEIEFDKNKMNFEIDFNKLVPCAKRRPEIVKKNARKSVEPCAVLESNYEENNFEKSEIITKNLEIDNEESKDPISPLYKSDELKISRKNSIKKMSEFRKDLMDEKPFNSNFLVEKLNEDFDPQVREFKKLRARKVKDPIYSYKKNETRTQFNLPYKHYFYEKKVNTELLLKDKLEKIKE